MISIEQLHEMVQEHLGVLSKTDGVLHVSKWVVSESLVCGRGLIATEDIAPGEIIFVDHPLIFGPRSSAIIKRGCAVCCSMYETFKCQECGLLLCSEECRVNEIHSNDCSLISRWEKKVSIEDIDDNLMSRALTSIRALLLNEDQKKLLLSLVAHQQPQHGIEIRELKQYFNIPKEEERLLINTSCILDANAYQIATPYGENEMSLRGLYPVASLMNHNCIPNIRYSFNSDHQMCVKAVKLIPEGSEIFTYYSGMLWGTPARRAHLFKTKHFWCRCERCSDPTEFGSRLAALKCLSSECGGSMLPVDPLNPSTRWQCSECALDVPAKNIAMLQSALGSLVGALDFDNNVNALANFLLNRILKFLPKTNQIVLDLQCRLIWEYGEAESYRWHELSERQLSVKEDLCRATLATLETLGVGDAHLRGLLLYHLHATLAERARRTPHLYEELKPEIESSIEQSFIILEGDISAPPDLALRRRYLGPGSDKPHQERFFYIPTLEQSEEATSKSKINIPLNSPVTEIPK